MSLTHLASKILAGGLTAGVFLLWWPRHFPDTGIEGLVIRGLLWTMSFELLLVTFSRVEDMVVGRMRPRLHPRRERVRAKLETAPPRVRSGSVVVVACVALAAPVAMLSEVAQNPLREKPETKVVRQVIVRKPVVKREVIVRKVVAAPAGQARPDAGFVAPAATTAAAPARPAATPAPTRRVRRSAPVPTRRSPTPAPAEPETAPVPAEAAPESASAPAPPSSSAPAP